MNPLFINGFLWGLVSFKCICIFVSLLYTMSSYPLPLVFTKFIVCMFNYLFSNPLVLLYYIYSLVYILLFLLGLVYSCKMKINKHYNYPPSKKKNLSPVTPSSEKKTRGEHGQVTEVNRVATPFTLALRHRVKQKSNLHLPPQMTIEKMLLLLPITCWLKAQFPTSLPNIIRTC